MNASSRNNDHCGGNEDMHGNRPMWIIAQSFNKGSSEHIFDVNGNKLTKEIMNERGHKEIVHAYSSDKMKELQIEKSVRSPNLNIVRRKCKKYEKVALL